MSTYRYYLIARTDVNPLSALPASSVPEGFSKPFF
jgi:hypothetical protein